MNTNKKLILTALISVISSLIICLIIVFVSAFYLLDTNILTTNNSSNETKTTSTSKNSATDVYNNSKNGVLTVLNKKDVDPNDFFRYYLSNSTEDSYTQGVGSGFIYKKVDGYYYALTNYHVVEGSDQIQVYPTPNDNTADSVTAEVVGYEPNFDMAILKFKYDKELTVLEFSQNDDVTPGEYVYAIGSPFGEQFAGSISHGIVNAPIRTLTQNDIEYKYIQTDAAINPGNSGGPLLNSNSKVIGMNTMKISTTEADNVGLAIPVSELKKLIDQVNY